MYRISYFIAILVLVPFYIATGSELNSPQLTSSTEESTDTQYEYYDPQNSEEAYKEYQNFQNSYAKEYRLSGLLTPPTTLHKELDEINLDYDKVSNIDEEEPVATTTIIAATELPLTTIKNKDDSEQPVKSLNDISASESLVSESNNTEYLSNKQAKMYVSVPSESESEPIYRSIKQNVNQKNAMYYSRNKSDEDEDYANDGNENETNDSQPITAQYSVDTTIPSLYSVPVTLSTKTILLTEATPTTSAISKKSAKKIEVPARVYKYSADEILRKSLENTYIRAPLATLINTAPEPLRKAKLLWKSTLRPNTPIDIVLVAFNSSGK